MYHVYRDGLLKQECKTHNEAFRYILKAQGQSFDYALKYGGWKVIQIQPTQRNEISQ